MSEAPPAPIAGLTDTSCPAFDLATLGPLAKYSSTGFAPTPFDQLRLAIMGPVKCGKSVLVQSDPNSLIFNTENGCGFVDARAAVFPDAKQFPSGLTMPMFLEAKEWLVKQAIAGKRPVKRVVFDTFTSFVQLVDQHLVGIENKKRESRSQEPFNSIIESGVDGGGYTKLAREVFSHLLAFELAGYGWTILVHQTYKTKKVKIGRDVVEVEKARCTLFPTTWDPIVARADYTCTMKKRFRKEYEKKTLPGGKEVTLQGSFTYVPQISLEWRLAQDNEEEETCGSRIPLADIPQLPLSGGMDLLRSHYDAAVASYRATLDVPPMETSDVH